MPDWSFYDLLKTYQKNHDSKILEDLLEKNISLVEHQVKKIYSNHLTTYLNITKEDLISFGLMGLLDSFNKYDFKKEISFESYARLRIKGSIIDGIRKFDFAPRYFREKAINYSEASFKLEKDFGRPPTEKELASYIGITVGELQKFWQKASYLTPLYLDKLISFEDEDSETFKDRLADDKQPSPEEAFEKQIDSKLLKDLIEDLPEREQLILSLYYYEDLTIKEIAEVMEISESRVSQLHSKAIYRLRGKLAWRKNRLS
ncbi:sigma-70 family RNA polymerase sigma factor [Natranaerofaba carboxydovora]|uniref:sigma-70 family RNA polymerase sigma factor n=1 Tax=Natranaerofaba carboxydovora TaxID=2742683 RepID=UPI001F145F2E|nr:FliA/WhiG family RNA polymerase sigma factor [Natranaerofaba carboxydovora]UMZ73388.1 RNA polymerase sigma-D factor [Natranaerofaba carboxydovora]